MGVWDGFRLIAAKLLNRNAQATGTFRIPYDLGHGAFAEDSDSVGVDGASNLREHEVNPDQREKVSRILTNIGKFVVDSAVDESLKGSYGGKQVPKVVEGLKDQPLSLSLDDERRPIDLPLVMEEMQAKMEKMQEDLNNVRQQNKTSTEGIKRSEPLNKIPTEGIKGSDLPKIQGKRIFIRSRL